MKTFTTQPVKRGIKFAGLALSSIVIASCAMSPEPPEGASEVRTSLISLQNNPDLADRARVELREAEEAVRLAEQPLSESDAALGEHRVYMAERAVAIAEARASTRYLEDQRAGLGEERDAARLRARTREVERARDEADLARSSQEEQAREYQAQIDALQAEITDRGVVLTLGDLLFETGSAELQGGASSNLNKLVSFLNEYPERRVQIEGHTDNVGSAAFNQELSQRRADAVRSYLVQQGIDSQRLSSTGIGMDSPVASNDSASGRQQNRRVEIIIDNPSR